MTCANHPEAPAAAYCRSCGKPLCTACQRGAYGTVYCEEHAPAVDASAPPLPTAPYAAPARANDGSAALAFLLGLIPGVGAIYNGQFGKGLVHALIFAMIVTIAGADTTGDLDVFFGFLIPLWIFYMALEAYHTARKKSLGEPVDEVSSLVDVHSRSEGVPVGALILIVMGGVMLLNTLEIVRLRQILRFWPVGLILLGIYMLISRTQGGAGNERR
ncbi:MAG: B-box zinc finger protein [Bryobacteraceae bacterium]